MDHVRVHYNSPQPAQLQAHAYAQGSEIHLAAGQKQHLPHEAWHVVQQAQGRVRPTMQLAGVQVSDDESLEREADLMGAEAAADDLLPQATAMQQRRELLAAQSPQVAASRALQAQVNRNPSVGSSVPVLQRAIRIKPETEIASWYTDPRDIEDAVAARKLPPSVVSLLKDMGNDGLTHAFDSWDAAVESVQVRLSRFETMLGLVKAFHGDLAKYKIPADLAGYNKARGVIERFNVMLDELGALTPHRKPFNLTILVGNLDGFGDISAGAKLARELRAAFDRIVEWRTVNVKLYLQKVELLRDERPQSSELASAISVAQGLLGDSVVQTNLAGPLPDSPEEDDRLSIDFAYPATNVDSVDKAFSIGQYGYDRLRDIENTHGSGPGHGSLGMLSIDPRQRRIATGDDFGDSPQMKKLHELMATYRIGPFHFGYFSKYEKPVKEFAREVAALAKSERFGIFMSRPAMSMESVAEALSNDGFSVARVAIKKDGSASDEAQVGPRKAPRGKLVLLVEFAEGVSPQEMLSLYYASDNPVGATGDQSFAEAYAMRDERNNAGKKQNPDAPDLLYDVAEQQRPLFHQLSELKDRKINLDKQGEKGLKAMTVDAAVVRAMQEKRLLLSVLLLINQALLHKQD